MRIRENAYRRKEAVVLMEDGRTEIFDGPSKTDPGVQGIGVYLLPPESDPNVVGRLKGMAVRLVQKATRWGNQHCLEWQSHNPMIELYQPCDFRVGSYIYTTLREAWVKQSGVTVTTDAPGVALNDDDVDAIMCMVHARCPELERTPDAVLDGWGESAPCFAHASEDVLARDETLHFFAEVHSNEVCTFFDGHRYARIPFRYVSGHLMDSKAKPKLVRITEKWSFEQNGRLYVWFALQGEGLPRPAVPPGVLAIRQCDLISAAKAGELTIHT